MHTNLRTIKTATVALRRNVMRSLLTCLGIIIGVAAVIAMMEIGHGSSTSISKSLATMGANMLMVFPGNAASAGASMGTGSSMSLSPQDCDAIMDECPAVRDVAPIVRARSAQAVYGGRNWIPATIQGTTPSILEIQNWGDVTAGEMFTDQDVRNANEVCVVGSTIVRQLFETDNPIGKFMRLSNVTFRVVGVLKTKGANMWGSDQDDIVMAPWTTIKYRVSGQSFGGAAQSTVAAANANTSTNSIYPNNAQALYPTESSTQQQDTPQPVRFTNVDQIICMAQNSRSIEAAIRQMTLVLHERHHIRAGEFDDFTIRDMTEMSKMLTQTSSVMANLLLGVALISLLVGGVGIMNIMLVSVTERTREIGLRMAVGARGKDILRQFLIEAVILCLGGGAVGILLGRGGSILVHAILKWPTEISVPAIVASVIVSATVGIVFGFYPAWKASRLDPIEALRYE
jgi:ABC-type antimicrobial peptide transport system permease subunit